MLNCIGKIIKIFESKKKVYLTFSGKPIKVKDLVNNRIRVKNQNKSIRILSLFKV